MLCVSEGIKEINVFKPICTAAIIFNVIERFLKVKLNIVVHVSHSV